MADISAGLPPRAYRKRRRLVLSCTECHRRKQKCDRLQPCTSCIARGKQTFCSYDEDGANEDSQTITQPPPPPLTADNVRANSTTLEEKLRHEQLVNEVNDLGYSSGHAFSTLGLIRQLENIEKVDSAANNPTEGLASYKSLGQYMNCIRQLPQQHHVDHLVKIFVSDVAWHYDLVDGTMFMEQLRIWRNVSYSTFQKALASLPPNIRCFPALLFQALAHGLLFADDDPSLEQLKYAPGMTLTDVAAEYSEAGETILSLLGKREDTIIRAQAGLLRASFLKSSGSVIEAWHALGAAIRDAQEIGLQSPNPPRMPPNLDEAAKADDMWFIEKRRKVWMVLHLWDAHMAIVLGRPMTSTELTAAQLPQQCLVNEATPTPFSLLVLGYHTAYKYLPKINHLQSTSQDYWVVEQIHASISQSIADWPDWCRAVDPAPTFDHLPWLPPARLFLITEVYFAVLALHRGHIFFSQRSRTEALKSSLLVLEAQAALFEASKTRHHLSFTFIFATFDAIVLTTTIFLKYPTENNTMLDASLNQIELTLDRFMLIGKQSKMARSAHSAISSLYTTLRKRFPTAVQSQQDFSESTDNSSTAHSSVFELSNGSTGEDIIASWCDNSNVTPPHPLPDLLLEDFPDAGMFSNHLSNPVLEDIFTGNFASYDFQSDLALVDNGL